MKKLKKLGSLALALVLAMALMVPAAFAADPNYDITITNAYPGNTYTAYKILDVESVGTNNQSYKIATGWENFFKTGAGAGTLEGAGADKTDLTGYVSWTKDSSYDLAAFAKAALEYAKTPSNNITAAGSASTTARTDDNYNKAESVTIELDSLGWYLVDTTNGALCSLDINTPNATIEEKNPAPAITKTSDNTNNSKQIGDTVTFTVNVTAQKGAQEYVVHDVMGSGLDFNEDVEVTVNGEKLNADTRGDYWVDYDPADNCTFEVIFTDYYLDKITDETEIVITYTAVINADAVTQSIGNKTQLTYGDNDSTPWSITGGDPGKDDPDVSTYFFDLVKTTSDNTILPNAQFSLTRGENETVKFTKTTVGGRDIYTVDPNGTETIITAGSVRVQGLGAVKYTLKEEKAPNGYNELTSPVTVDLANKENKVASFDVDGKYKADVKDNPDTEADETFTNKGVQVINYTGAELPSTGGIGTTIFYVLGGLLLAGSAILFVTKKRMGSAD